MVVTDSVAVKSMRKCIKCIHSVSHHSLRSECACTELASKQPASSAIVIDRPAGYKQQQQHSFSLRVSAQSTCYYYHMSSSDNKILKKAKTVTRARRSLTKRQPRQAEKLKLLQQPKTTLTTGFSTMCLSRSTVFERQRQGSALLWHLFLPVKDRSVSE